MINNGFLWLIALVPLAWILQTLLFAAVPLDCTLAEAFDFSNYVTRHASEDPLLWKLFWPSLVWSIGVDTLFYIMDELEVRKRGFTLGGWVKRWTAYLIPPYYIWMRGDPSFNGGSRNHLPYIVWWIGTAIICYFDGGFLYVAIASAIAASPFVLSAIGKIRPSKISAP